MIARIKNLLRSEGLKSTAIVTVGNIISAGLGAVAMIMAFRLLDPSDFGNFSAVFAIMMIIVKVADLGTNVALQKLLSQPEDVVGEADKKSVWGLIFCFKLGVGILLTVLSFFLAPWLSTITHIPAGYLMVGVASALGMIIYDQAVMTAQAKHEFGLTVVISGLQSVLKIIGLAFFFLTGHFSLSLLIMLYGLAPLFSSVVIPARMVIPLGKINWSKGKRMVWHIAKWTSIAIISAAIADNIDILMIQSLLGPKGTGIYSAAARIAGFVAIVGYAIGVVLSVRVAKYKTKEHLDQYLKKAGQLAILSFLVMLLTVPFAGLLINLTAGSAYLGAVISLRYLLLAVGLVMATSPYVALFYTFDKPQYFAYSGILIAVLLLVGNYLVIPVFGINGAGMVKLVTRIISFLYTYLYARYSYREYLHG